MFIEPRLKPLTPPKSRQVDNLVSDWKPSFYEEILVHREEVSGFALVSREPQDKCPNLVEGDRIRCLVELATDLV